MENEILINRLINAIESPDWWIIGITLVNAIFMAWLGWRQYKLQKQQIYQQEYNIYSRLYPIVEEMDRIINCYLFYLLYSYCTKESHDFYINKIEEISKCIDDLEDNRIDFELKFSQNKDAIFAYKSIMKTICSIYQTFFNLYFELEEENKNLEQVRFIISKELIWRNDDKIVETILLLIDDEDERKLMKISLQNYLEKKSYLRNYKLLDKIQKRCYGG